jgi:hypothetical protein
MGWINVSKKKREVGWMVTILCGTYRYFFLLAGLDFLFWGGRMFTPGDAAGL